MNITRVSIVAALCFACKGGNVTVEYPAKNALPAPTPVKIASGAPDLAVPADAVATPSGLRSRVLSPGQGERRPLPTEAVTVHYTGWLEDGTVFDSSIPRGAPTTFPVGAVIPGWIEGLQLMHVGEKRRLWIPSKLAYGERGASPKIPANANLIFDVELISIR